MLKIRSFPKTDLIQKNIEDFRDYAKDHIGKVKNLGQTEHLQQNNQIFGKNPKPSDVWHAKECIMGEATFQENYKDDALGMFLFTKTKKLGRATKFGFRNKTRNGDENRIFGTPSIRDDIGKPKQISVACTYVSGFNLKKNRITGMSQVLLSCCSLMVIHITV